MARCEFTQNSSACVQEVRETLNIKVLIQIVNFSWNDVISTSPATMKKFKLDLTNSQTYWVHSHQQIMKLKRNFQAIKVDLESDPSHDGESSSYMLGKFLEVAAQHGSQIRKLVLRCGKFKDANDFCKILSCMPLLEILDINGTRFGSLKHSSSHEEVMLRNLRILKVDYSDWSCFQYLMTSQITTLIIMNSTFRSETEERKYLINFLQNSVRLQTLKIGFCPFLKMFQCCERFHFKLKMFSFFNRGEIAEAFARIEENFVYFLDTQADSMEEVYVNSTSPAIVQAILTKLNCLKTLTINAASLPNDVSFYEQIKPLEKLTGLYTRSKFPNTLVAKEFYSKIPNIQSLKIDNDINVLKFLAFNNKEVQGLSIWELNSDPGTDLAFDKLTFLYINFVSNIKFISSILRSNPALVTLSFRLFGDEAQCESSINDFVTTALNHPNLKHLKFYSDSQTNKQIFDKIKINYKKLQSLTFFDIFSQHGRSLKPFTYSFPQNPADWDTSCEFYVEPRLIKHCENVSIDFP